MAEIVTTKMLSKGHVVIPEKIRDQLGLKEGVKFIVLRDKDSVILKTISAPLISEFNQLVFVAKKAAKKAGLKNADISKAIRRARGRN